METGIRLLTVLALSTLLILGGARATAESVPAYSSSALTPSPEPMSEDSCTPDALAAVAEDETLQPGVRQFIADTYLAHKAEYPDPNETVEALKTYLEGDQLLRDGRVDEATKLFRAGVALYPDSRHVQAGLAWAMQAAYEGSGSKQQSETVWISFCALMP